MYRNSYVEIDLDKLAYNADLFRKRNNKGIIAVIKADGYGIVDQVEAETLSSIGIDHFAVSSLDEALHLRRSGIEGEILILGHVPEYGLNDVRENGLSIVTVSKDYVLNADLQGVKVHLKIDTGMNRIGIEPEQAKEVYEILMKKGALVEGIMSHFSSADCDRDYSIKQYAIFRQCVKELDHDFKYVHMAATDAALTIDDDVCNYQRIGLGLLGFSAYDAGLKPCVSLHSEVIMSKTLSPGETVSYGRHFVSDGKGHLSTIPLGYADGFWRANTGHKVYIGDEYGTIVGSICMDQLMILSEHEHPCGTGVELFGEHVDMNERAQDLGTIVYELLTGLSDRLERRYVRQGKTVSVIDPRFPCEDC